MKIYHLVALTCATLMPAMSLVAQEEPSRTVRLGIIGSQIGETTSYTARAFTLSVGVGDVTGGAVMGNGNSVASFAVAGGPSLDLTGTDTDTPHEVQVFPDFTSPVP